MLVILIIVFILFAINKKKKGNQTKIKKSRFTKRELIDYVVKVAIFSTIAALLYTVPFLQFKLPFFPAFLEFQFSNLPAILAGFILGPLGGTLVEIIKTLVKLPMSHTACVGELADLVIGVSVVVSSSLIYKKNKTIKGGLIALIVGTIIWVFASLLANYTFLIRWYGYFFGMDLIIDMTKAVLPFVNENNFMFIYLTCCCLPFNLIIALLTSLITFITYKKISKIFKKEFFKK